MTSSRTVHHTPTQPAPDDLDRRLQYMLQCVADRVSVGAACILAYDERERQLEVAAARGTSNLDATAWARVCTWVTHRVLNASQAGRGPVIERGPHPHYPIALIYAFTTAGDQPGGLVLFGDEATFDPATTPQRLAPMVDIMAALLDNRAMAQKLISTESIAAMIHTFTRDPSPRGIVNGLLDHVFDTHITACAIGFYGPLAFDEDGVQQPFDHLELAATWSRSSGPGVGVGWRFPLAIYPEIALDLPPEGLSLGGDALDGVFERLDPYSRRACSSNHVRSATLVPLRVEKRHLGVLMIGADRPMAPTPHEQRVYQIIAEFLAMGTVANSLAKEYRSQQIGRTALLDAVNDGVVVVLADAEATVVELNATFMQMFDLDRRQAHRVPLATLLQRMRVPEPIRAELGAAWAGITPTDRERRAGEFTMNGTHGHHTEIRWYIAPVTSEDAVLGRIFIFHDITADREAERLRAELLSRISHELRTPLTAIRGFAEMILAEEGDSLPDLAREYTDIIYHSANHLNRVFTDIIEIARAEAGALDLFTTEADLTAIIADTVARLEPLYTARQQAITLDLDSDHLPLVNADLDRIGQVLTHLIANAVKHAPPGSTILISARYYQHPADLPASAPADVITPCALVSVVDPGPGLSEAECDKVFYPFFRTDEARRYKTEGSGLGLAVAHSIVKLHRGNIWAEAATHHQPGGRFLFTLPTRYD